MEYEGGWYENCRSGKGTHYLQNSAPGAYQGELMDGKKHGKGTYYEFDGR